MLDHHGEFQGTYEISALVNGKPSWTSQSKAIWYIQNRNMWMIGHLSSIGKPNGPIYTTGTLFGPSEVNWNSYIEKMWKKLDKNDFTIECVVRKGTNQQLLIQDDMIIYSRLLFEKL